MDKPLLLIDFDGPLNPDREDRPGFEPGRIVDEAGMSWDVMTSPAHGRSLTRLADRFELVWATTWWRVANEVISPLLGLPDDLACIRLPYHRRDDPSTVEGGAFWKTPHVRKFAAGRPVAWLDDEVHEVIDTEALTGRFEHGSIYADTEPVPAACVVRVGSKWGLERSHLKRVTDWAEALERGAS